MKYFNYQADQAVLQCVGDWTVDNLAQIDEQMRQLRKKIGKVSVLDGSEIKHLDTAGALWLEDLITYFKRSNASFKSEGFTERHQSTLNLVAKHLPQVHKKLSGRGAPNWFYVVGQWGVDKYSQIRAFFAFIGEMWIIFYRSILNPLKIQWKSIVATVDETGYQALPIIALMNFLIGLVLAYQLADQLKQYGADIYIVDVTGIGILREFAPLITSIILAGRTSTAFAALMGTMKVNQEIDALLTMGLSPIARLVLPRVIGLMIALPLLTVWADFFGVLGSMLMAQDKLNINYYAFLQRFEETVALRHYVLGLVKTPVFAMIIAGVGCFQGFQTVGSAASVGEKTTKAAVQAIFLVIVADALFSILFSKMGY